MIPTLSEHPLNAHHPPPHPTQREPADPLTAPPSHIPATPASPSPHPPNKPPKNLARRVKYQKERAPNHDFPLDPAPRNGPKIAPRPPCPGGIVAGLAHPSTELPLDRP